MNNINFNNQEPPKKRELSQKVPQKSTLPNENSDMSKSLII